MPRQVRTSAREFGHLLPWSDICSRTSASPYRTSARCLVVLALTIQTSLPLYPQTTSPIRKELIYGLVPKLCSDEGTWKGCLERYNGFLSSNFNNFVINVIRTKHRGQGTYRLPSIWKWDLVVINTLSSGNLSWRKFYFYLLFFILVLSSSLMNYIKSSNVSFFSFLFSGLRWHYISVILGLFFISVKP